MKQAPKKLNLDFLKLFPSKTFVIGDEQIVLYPLSYSEISKLVTKLQGFSAKFSEEGINFENFNQPENLYKLVSIALANFPEVLEEVTGVDRDSLAELPLDILVDLIAATVEINLESKETLLKNWKRLIEIFPQDLLSKVQMDQKKTE